MKIDGKRIITFIIKKDGEVYTMHLADTENKTSDEYKTTSIGLVPDNADRIASLVTNDKYAFVGYGNKYRDNIMLNYFLANRELTKKANAKFVTESIDRTLERILEEQDQDLAKQYKYAAMFNSFDLQRFLFAKDETVTLEQYIASSDFEFTDEGHDVQNIANILDASKARIEARLKVEEIYGVDLFDGHEGTVGARLMKFLYATRNNIKMNELRCSMPAVAKVSLGGIMLPEVGFATEQNRMNLDEIRKDVVDLQTNWFRYVPYRNLELGLNMAGLRLNTGPKRLFSDNDGDVYAIDVASFYPSIAVAYGIKPMQVNDVFMEIYSDMLVRRLAFKRTDKDASDCMKYMLNGIIGQFMIENSWLYDPMASMKIRINGALFMLMLIERLYGDFSIECVTIDGMFVKSRKPNSIELLRNIVGQWSEDTRLNADIKRYDSVWMLSNNDYITSDMTEKGFFSYKQNNGKARTPNIVRTAVVNNLMCGVPVSETITKCYDMGQFMSSISSNETLEWHGDLFNSARYYHSSDNRIGKITEDSMFNVKTVPVTQGGVTVNYAMPETMQEDLDYNWYISEANRVLEKINVQQLSLFQ